MASYSDATSLNDLWVGVVPTPLGRRDVLPVLLLVSDADGEVHQDDGDDDQGHSGDVEQPALLLEECESPTAAVTTPVSP